jgi:hypothetical protein
MDSDDEQMTLVFGGSRATKNLVDKLAKHDRKA